MLPLDQSLEFRPRESFFAGLPPVPGVFLIEMHDPSAEPYLARTADIRRAAERLLRAPDELSKRLNLRAIAARFSYRETGSKFEQTFALYQHSRALFPQKYRERLKLRGPAMLKINLRNSYPRCYVTRGLRADEGFYYGPFPSRRAAEAFNEGVLDLFKIRRCQIKIRRDPTFPGCIYSDMKMCMAPCFAGCTKAEYDADVTALAAALDTQGGAILDPLELERETARESLDFERAAALHKRVEKVKAAFRGIPDVTRRINRLDAVILQRAAAEKTVLLFPVRSGQLSEPLSLNFVDLSEPRSVEATIRELLEPQPQTQPSSELPPTEAIATTESESAEIPSASTGDASLRECYGLQSAPAELTEHLALISRWFYSKPRQGEILFREKGWPYRRLLRACSRLLNPPASEPAKEPTSPN